MTSPAAATTLFQRNRRVYIDEETRLVNFLTDESFLLAFQNWLESTVGGIDAQYETCERQLAELQQQVAVEAGTYWNSRTLTLHCNLYLDSSRLVKKGAAMKDSSSWPDLINLVSSLNQLKTRGFITPKQRKFIEQCEQELQHVMLDSSELLSISEALQTKLRDDGNTRNVFSELTKYQNAVDELIPGIDRCEQLLEASLHNGEMSLAEELSKRQLQLYEHVLKLIMDQYPIIDNYHMESRDGERRRRWAIFRMVNKDITAVIDKKNRQVEVCEDDLLKIKQQLDNFRNDDAHQRKRYEQDRAESDKFLLENKEKQQSVWNRVHELYKELQTCQGKLSTLAHHRRHEVDRRLQMEELEAGRRSGHEAFIYAAAKHAQRLQDTIDNALAVKDVASALNDFVLDGCDSIASKYDKQQNLLTEALRLIQLHHFKRFSDYTVSASRLLYRKDKQLDGIESEMRDNDMKRELLADSLDVSAKQYAEANAQLMLKRREAADELLSLRHRLSMAEKNVQPTLRSLELAGVAFTHPQIIAEKMNEARKDQMLVFREAVNPSVTANDRILAEEFTKLATLRERLREFNGGNVDQEADDAQPQVTPPRIAPITVPALQRAPVFPYIAAGATAEELRTLPTKPAASSFLPPIGSAGSTGKEGYGKTASTGKAAAASSMGAATATGPARGQRKVGGQASGNEQDDGASSARTGEAASAAARPLYPTKMEGTTFKALYGYQARAPDELTFEEGDTIICLSRGIEEGWFKGISNQRTGLFPVNYVAPAGF